MKTWKITYWIEHGGYEYSDYLLRQAAEMTEAAAAAAVADWWCADDEPDDKERFRRELIKKGCAALPASGRFITALGWEAIPPITVTIHNGIVEDIAHLPEGVSAEVRDLDDDDRDGQGRLVPWISVWEGPRQPRGL